MRQDLLANLDDQVRNTVAAFDEEGTWLSLVNHLFQTCGPPDIHTAVYTMLKEAASEEPARNLQQRIQTIVVAWQRAQSIYIGVHSKMHAQVAACPPCRCSSFIPIHQWLATLQGLLLRCGPTLWQVNCSRTERRLHENPITGLNFILALISEALQLVFPSTTRRICPASNPSW